MRLDAWINGRPFDEPALNTQSHGEVLNPPVKRRILCVCDPRPGQTSGYRLRAFQRLGQDVIPFDVSAYEPRSRILSALRFRLPSGPLIYRVNRDLLNSVRQHKPDVVWFDKPVHFTKNTILEIKAGGAQTVCYNQDNPFGPRKDPGWLQFHRMFRLFDLHCLLRTVDIARYSAWGLPWIKVLLSYEPTVHFPPPPGWSDDRRTRGVSYVGSPYEDRPQFLQRLVELQLPVVISGPRWRKFLPPEFVARYVSHDYLADSGYREAIWQSRVNLGFVTQLNEEDIGHKSMEIAACQGFLLTLRTAGHQAAFDEDREAVFFSSLEECAEKCRFYLERPALREGIAQRGRDRAVQSGYDNDTQLAKVLRRLDGRDQGADSEG
jgi:hypothetical protein